MTNLIGRTINGRYRLESLLGDGGMGTVYRAHDLNLDRPVAIKLMHAHFARRSEFRARLIQEAQTTAQLDHPSVVNIFDFGESDDGLFIAMEYVDGGSLREHLRRLQRMQKYLPLVQSLQIAAQIADALDYAHRRGIIHRDVKPGNIMLKRLTRPDEPGEQPFRAMLTDFGLVKLVEGNDLTQSGATLGTPTYMSPEQCAGEKLDGRSDLYSLGIVLYELVTNRLPFNFQSLSEAINTHNQGNMPAPAHELRDDVPALIDQILRRTLAKDPANRYTSGAELADALRSAMVALSGAPTQVMVREEMDILDRVSDPPAGYELTIDTPGHTSSSVPLTRAVITLGRHADNDIVLPAEGVSRHHARLQATSLGWEVVDLGGINGTFLNERRLRADDPTPIVPGGKVKVGPYTLTLHGPEITIVEQSPSREVPGATTPPLAQQQQQTQLADVAPLAMFLANDKLSVEAGNTVALTAEIVNRSAQDDRVSLRVQGVPAAWVTSPGEFVSLPAGQTVQLSVDIRPPRHPGTPTGRQRVRLELISQQHPQFELGANASLMLTGFVSFEASLDQDQITLPGMVTVSIRNTGNAAADFSLVARDRQRALQFRGERGRIRLQPGQTANVELAVEGERGSLFGSSELYPFDVEVSSATGERQRLSAAARAGAAIPPTLRYAFLFVLTFLCALSGFFVLWNRGLFGGNPAATPTLPGLPAINVTETVISGTETAVAATNVAATAAVLGDNDEDGLSNTQEATIGTDPENPDTDGDGLTDGEEVLTIGTNPLNRDSDGDLLDDGEEVNEYGTDPTRADTDGDGVLDSTEILNGTDPNATPPATATPILTATATETAVPTTPTATATQAPPSATPTATNTPLPSATATNTPIPSATATATNTPIPSATPTATHTPLPTATATATQLPNPQLVCVNTPPTIDGVFNVTEWTGAPLIQFASTGNPNNRVQVYFTRDETALYMAFLINDATNDNTDSLRIYFDTTRNGGDPDSADRFFQIARDGTLEIQAGQGNNSDGIDWNSNYDSTNWQAALGEPGGGQWVVEMQIDANAEMGALTDPFAMMLATLFTGDGLVVWPPTAVSDNLSSYQGVNNVVCESN